MKESATTPTRPKAAGVNGLPLPNFSLLENGGQTALNAWVQSNEVFVKGTFDIAQQLLSFGQARLDDDLSTLRTMMACHDLTELAECQKQFAEKAAAQYMDQANKLTSKLTNLLSSAAAQVKAGAPAEPQV